MYACMFVLYSPLEIESILDLGWIEDVLTVVAVSVASTYMNEMITMWVSRHILNHLMWHINFTYQSQVRASLSLCPVEYTSIFLRHVLYIESGLCSHTTLPPTDLQVMGEFLRSFFSWGNICWTAEVWASLSHASRRRRKRWLLPTYSGIQIHLKGKLYNLGSLKVCMYT